MSKELLNSLLQKMEDLREQLKNDRPTFPDHTIRLCEAIVADEAGYTNRADWKRLQKTNSMDWR